MEPVVEVEEKMESDVLELECNIDDLEQKPKTPPPAPKAEIAPAEADLKNSRLLWISGIDETMKANDFRVAFEPHGKVESGKLVKFGEKGCKGIVMMKTVEGADKVIEQLNGTKISGFEVKIEKRLTDPTVKSKPKEKDPILTPIETKSKIINLSAINKRKYEEVEPLKSSEKKPEAKCNLSGPSDDELKKLDRQLSDARQSQRRTRERNNQLRVDLKKLRKEKSNEENQSNRAKDKARDTRKQRAQLNKDLEESKSERQKVKKTLKDTQDDIFLLRSKIRSAKTELQKYKEARRELERSRDNGKREEEEREKLEAERRKVKEDRQKYEEERKRLERERSRVMNNRRSPRRDQPSRDRSANQRRDRSPRKNRSPFNQRRERSPPPRERRVSRDNQQHQSRDSNNRGYNHGNRRPDDRSHQSRNGNTQRGSSNWGSSSGDQRGSSNWGSPSGDQRGNSGGGSGWGATSPEKRLTQQQW